MFKYSYFCSLYMELLEKRVKDNIIADCNSCNSEKVNFSYAKTWGVPEELKAALGNAIELYVCGMCRSSLALTSLHVYKEQ